jgi:hypothetical protein
VIDEEYPRVVDLSYGLQMCEGHKLAEGAKLEGEIDCFRFVLENLVATFYPLKRFRTEAEAREALEPQLRAWEISSGIPSGRIVLRFKFLSCFVQPEAPQPGHVYVRGVAAMLVAGRVAFTLTHAKHPAPSREFAVNDCVEDLAAQFFESRENPKALLKSAYSMVTRLAFEFGGLPKAASALNISEPLLRKINELSTTRGVGVEVRKFKASLPRSPLSPGEREWLAAALEAVLRRTGLAAAGSPVGDALTLTSLPLPVATVPSPTAE